MSNRGNGFGGKNGRIILLGDGSEGTDDTGMFDHNEEDKDTKNQISKGTGPSHDDEESIRSEREGTPAPSSAPVQRTESPSSTQTEDSDRNSTVIKPISDGVLKPEETK